MRALPINLSGNSSSDSPCVAWDRRAVKRILYRFAVVSQVLVSSKATRQMGAKASV